MYILSSDIYRCNIIIGGHKMAKRHSTKRALIASVLALALCFSALVGTTFAWFTDSVTSANNIIKSGTLDVQMFWADGTEAPASASWNNAETSKVFDYDKWEPGYTEARHIKIYNNGSLSLKYMLKMFPDGEIGKLADVIDVFYTANAAAVADRDVSSMTKLGTLTEVIKGKVSSAVAGVLDPEKEAVYTFVLKMQEDADNDYQGESVGDSFSFKLIATQATVEDDSFDENYDKDAQYPAATSPSYTLPTENYEAFTLSTEDANASSVRGTAALAQDIAEGGATKITLVVSEPVTSGDVITFAEVALYDQNGKEIDLSENTELIDVKLYVGTENAGKNVTVKHDGVTIATGKVDELGYIAYSATHFCEVQITFVAEAITPSVGNNTTIVTPDGDIVGGDDADKVIEELDPKTPVQILVGKNFYTVSAGMAASWYENPAIKGQITATVYIPEDLLAYSMMYKNGDLDEKPDGNGSHSDLTLASDLDFAGKNWEPIGRFYTNIHGENKKISNLSDSLFGGVYDCQISNLTLENVTASGSASGVIAKELAGDIYIDGVTIAGENTVSYVSDSKSNWPEGGTCVGAICGVSLIGYSGHGEVNVTVAGSITVNYGEETLLCRNTTNLENLSVSAEFGLNVYKPNANAKVTVADGGKIEVKGDYEIELADGVVANSALDVYKVYNANGLKWIASKTNSVHTYTYEEYPFTGKTVKLMNDIDLGGEEWTPIANYRFSATLFTGVFDGQGHTVSNFKITARTEGDDNKSAYGFFGNVDGTVKNLTVENAYVNDYAYTAALIGRLNGGTVENCHVKDSEVICGYWQAGALVAQQNGPATIIGCSVSDTTVTSASAVGLLSGVVSGDSDDDVDSFVYKNCTVKDSAVIQNGSFGAGYDVLFGSLFASIDLGKDVAYIDNCKVENTTVKGKLAAPISGEILSKTYIDGKLYIADGLAQDEETKAFYVSSGAGLAYLNANWNSIANNKATVINLTADIDFTGYTWAPLDSHADLKTELDEINGNGYTISNLTVNGQAMFKRFAGTGDVVIKNITFDNANVNSTGLNASILVGQSYQNVLLDNVDVKNSSITGSYKVAPLIATLYNENPASTVTATLKNCDVSDCTVKATTFDFCTAGMVSFVYAEDGESIEFENCTVTNVKLIAPNDGYKAHAAVYTTDSESLYNTADGVTVTNCTFEALG